MKNTIIMNNINFPISIGGLIEMDFDSFQDIMYRNLEAGTTYRLSITHEANYLTKNGIPFNSILYTMPDHVGLINKSYLLGTNRLDKSKLLSKYKDGIFEDISKLAISKNELLIKEKESLLELKRDLVLNSPDLINLQCILEKMLINSDLIKEIY
jgi:hypothetical protein